MSPFRFNGVAVGGMVRVDEGVGADPKPVLAGIAGVRDEPLLGGQLADIADQLRVLIGDQPRIEPGTAPGTPSIAMRAASWATSRSAGA